MEVINKKLRGSVYEYYLKGYSSFEVAEIVKIPIFRITSYYADFVKIKDTAVYKIERLNQIKTIENELFKLIENKAPAEEIDVIQQVYSTYLI